MNSRLSKAAAALLLGAFVATSGGCLVMSGTSVEQHGVRVTRSTLDQVEIGTTSEAWVVATLGEPTERTTVEGQEHVSVLRYDFVESRSEGGTVFLIFAGGKDVTTTTRTFFEVTGGVVSRYWTEP
jgi:outer membrane protein assembly factor BamE (lipoprotein component of BamABCDE complex)